jgi:catalase
VLLGRLAVQRRMSPEEFGDPMVIHESTPIKDRIDVSDDPTLDVRRGVYEVSAVNRGGGLTDAQAASAS